MAMVENPQFIVDFPKKKSHIFTGCSTIFPQKPYIPFNGSSNMGYPFLGFAPKMARISHSIPMRSGYRSDAAATGWCPPVMFVGLDSPQ